MNTTEISQKIPLLTFLTRGRLAYLYMVALPILVLAGPSWSQAQSGHVATQTGPIIQDGIQQTEPGRIPPNLQNGVHPGQPSPSAQRRTAAAAQMQATTATPPFGKYSFVTISIPNATNVQPNGVNDSGLVTGYFSDANYNTHGFIWKNGTATTLDYPGATGTFLTGVNNRGVLVGYYTNGGVNIYAVTYSVSLSTWSVLPDIPNYLDIEPSGINDRGEAVGIASSYYPLGTLSWIWHPDSLSYSFFSVPGAREASTYPTGVNEDEQVVGSFNSWAAIYAQIGFLKAGCKGDEGEDSDGHCTYHQINVPGAFGLSIPLGINNHGTVAGYFFDLNSDEYGFVRTRDGVFTGVNVPSSAGNTQVTGINDNGVLCGVAYTPPTYAALAFVAYPQ